MIASTRFVPLLLLGAVVATTVTASALPAAAAEGGVAWTVQTADNDNGTGRANFTYDVDPGQAVSDTMIVVNTGTESLPLAVYAADAFTTTSGEIDVLVDGTPSEDAGTWVTVEPASLELLPGQRAEVPFTIAVPPDARPGDHAAGIVTSLTSRDAASSLSVDRRLGTRINLRVAGELSPAAAVRDVTARYAAARNPLEAGRLTVEYTLDNTGNTRLTGIETLAAAGPASLFAAAGPATQLNEVIPGSSVVVTREIEVFSIGWLGGSISISPEGVGLGAGSAAPIVVDFSLAAVPWGLYTLLALIVALTVVAVLVVHRRLRRRAAGDDGAVTVAAEAAG